MKAAEKNKGNAAAEKSKGNTAAAPNVDPHKKEAPVRLTLEEREFQAARAKIEQELEKYDCTPERLKLFKRVKNEGCCKCESCQLRRCHHAMHQVHKDAAVIREEAELNAMIQKAYQGDYPAVIEALQKYRDVALDFFGGPIAVTGCEECKKQHPAIPCYHCGREPWMKTRKDMVTCRRDLKQFERYIMTGLLHAACLSGHVQLCTKLIAMEADVNGQDDMGKTPLHWLCCSGHKPIGKKQRYVSIAELLLTHGADVTLMDKSGKTPTELTYMPCPNFNEMRMVVLKHAKPQLNENLLQFCQDGDVDMAMRMIQAGADLMTGDWLNDTPLHVAVTFGRFDLIDKLLDTARGEGRLLNAIHAENVEGQTSIDVAIRWGYKSTASKLRDMVMAQQVKDAVAQMARGGVKKVPAEFKGTLLGKEIEAQLKEQSKLQKRMVKALRMEQIAQKRESKLKNYKGGKKSEEEDGEAGSRTCVIA